MQDRCPSDESGIAVAGEFVDRQKRRERGESISPHTTVHFETTRLDAEGAASDLCAHLTTVNEASDATTPLIWSTPKPPNDQQEKNRALRARVKALLKEKGIGR